MTLAAQFDHRLLNRKILLLRPCVKEGRNGIVMEFRNPSAVCADGERGRANVAAMCAGHESIQGFDAMRES